jgi:hypothetical protein
LRGWPTLVLVAETAQCRWSRVRSRVVGPTNGIHRPDGAWWEIRLFSDAERAALKYAEALTRASGTTATQAVEPYHDGLTAHFDEVEMLGVVAVGVTMDVWTRLKLARAGCHPLTPPDPTEASHPPDRWRGWDAPGGRRRSGLGHRGRAASRGARQRAVVSARAADGALYSGP